MLYADLLETVGHLTSEKAWELFKHILLYVNDEDPKTEDMIINIAFTPIKQSLKRDLIKWKIRAENSRENGKLWWRPPKKTRKKPIKPSGFKNNPSEPTEPVTVTVTVTDTVTDIKEVSKDTEPTVHWNKEINNLISELKKLCNEMWVSYDKTKDRMFWKYICTAKDYGEFCEKIWQTRIEFALNILRVSIRINFWEWVCSGPLKIYKSYAEVYNKAKLLNDKNKSTVLPWIKQNAN